MTPAERDRFYQQVFDAFNVPAETMAEGRPHSRARSAALDALTRHFRTVGRQIYLADELAVVYPNEPTFTPDLLAVQEVPQPDPDEDERMAWVLAEEGRGPDFILEVLHKGNRDKALVRNVADYARLGIREYFVYDRMNFRLYGHRLTRSGSHYQPLRPRLGRMTSEVLGLDLALVQRRLRFFSGMAELMNSDEFIERLSAMMDGIEARATQAEAQAEEERAQVERERAERLREQQEAVLDLAEAYAIEVTPEQRQAVRQATLGMLADLRRMIKATRRWPG